MKFGGGLLLLITMILGAACQRLPERANLPANINIAANRQTINANNAAPINYAQPVPTEKPTEVPTAAGGGGIIVVPPLVIPVQGVKKEELQDTFTAARSEGRVHDAIDIMSPGGVPVLAAADGEIAKFFDSERGGITIYQYDQGKRLIYYYAHLQRRADNIKEGDFVHQGAVIGYVGDTGNAGAGNTHLHFAVWTITDPKKIWDGENINPYTLLKRAK